MNWAKLLLINLGAGLLVLSPFVPGPPNGLVNFFYNAGQILGLLGVFAIPIGLIWTTKELKRKRNDKQYQVDLKAILLLTLPLTLFLTSIFISGRVRNFSRDFAINRTEDLIESIEKFKATKGQYPDSLTDLTPEYISAIPSPYIMGIDKYHYQKQGDIFTVSFQQNVILSFNFEVVTFDPTDNHKTDGQLTDIYDTGKSHWKYYVYD
ncbi:MAG: hypothetical protein IM631_02060 [Cytophagales bacterium]|nr:hypothetical protein [Cytophagales bacterium]MCA6370153.1 hypothetical protein [Cytophagales bacterium]MCA6375038.1 hypothetical protein [Cytophagales bacterium]MCA6385506.1 hypothetical protein [Cytophagales bacterium]